MMQSNLSFLGLIKRANALVSGDRMIEGIRKKNVHCVLLSNSASERTQKVIRNKCAFYNIPIIDSLSTIELQSVLSGNVVAVGITNYEMAQKVLKEMRIFDGETDKKRQQEDN